MHCNILFVLHFLCQRAANQISKLTCTLGTQLMTSRLVILGSYIIIGFARTFFQGLQHCGGVGID